MLGPVLVVDDERDILESLESLLGLSLNVPVVLAPSGPHALAVLANHPVDLIVSDYSMPGMDGLEFLRRSREACPGAQRMLMTAYPDLQVALRALNDAGVSHFIPKPIRPQEFCGLVSEALGQALRARQAAGAMRRATGSLGAPAPPA